MSPLEISVDVVGEPHFLVEGVALVLLMSCSTLSLIIEIVSPDPVFPIINLFIGLGRVNFIVPSLVFIKEFLHLAV